MTQRPPLCPPASTLSDFRAVCSRLDREGESFTASADCPSCGHLAVHWLDEPRPQPDEPTPVQQLQRTVHHMAEAASMMTGATVARLYDPPETVVARVCVQCGYRWGQA